MPLGPRSGSLVETLRQIEDFVLWSRLLFPANCHKPMSPPQCIMMCFLVVKEMISFVFLCLWTCGDRATSWSWS